MCARSDFLTVTLPLSDNLDNISPTCPHQYTETLVASTTWHSRVWMGRGLHSPDAMKSLLFTIGLLCVTCAIHAAPVTYQFTGTTSQSMNVNNGTSVGSVPAGTPYTGTLVFEEAQSVAAAAFWGGTHSAYRFTIMTLTVGATTVSWGPGTIDVYDNVTSTGGGYPVGDSFYANITAPLAPSGTINGAQFNWIMLGLVDPTGTVFAGSGLPANLNLGTFQNPFIEFNFGTLGTPWGAGNTSMLQFLSTLSKTSATPAPPPTITTTSLPPGVIGVPYSAPVTASAPNGDSLTVTVTNLPAGLSFAGGTVSGSPTAIGTWNVVISATDTVTGLSTSSTLPLAINDAPITFTPTLPAGVTNYPYSATFAAATGGTGSFTYSVTGLPAGLSLSGNTVSGAPTVAGTYTVLLTATDKAGYALTATVTLSITNPVPVPCSGQNAVESAYVPRTPGYIVVNGGLNLLDHLWTTNLNASNTTFLGGLVNWYQTGLILDYAGTVDPNGCILTRLTVRPAVTIDTTALPHATAGAPYSAAVGISWGVTPYAITLSGLPAGLAYIGGNVSGTPAVAGTYVVTITAIDAVGASASRSLILIVDPSSATYTIADEGQGKITSVGSGYLMVGSKKLIWNAATLITVNQRNGEVHIIDSFVKAGMKVQWKGMLDQTTHTVLTSRLEVN